MSKKKPFRLLVIVTTRTTTKPRGQTDTIDDLSLTNEQTNMSINISTSLTKEGKLFNAVNDVSDGYKTSCVDRWKPIKAYITEHEALPREALKPP